MEEGRFSVIETVKEAWHLVKGSKKAIWAIFIVFVLLQVLSALITKDITLIQSTVAITLLKVLKFILSIITTILAWGLIYLGIRRAENIPIHHEMVKHVFNARLILRMVFLYVLQLLVILPPIIVAIVALETKLYWFTPDSNFYGLATAFSYAIIVVAFLVIVYLIIRMYMGQAIVLAENLGPWKAIKKSFAMTHSKVWRLLGLLILNTLILVVSAIPLGIGLIWSIPYNYINYGVLYRKLSQYL